MRVASDIGGTFTDLVHLDERTGQIGVAKVSATPANFAEGVIETRHKACVRVPDTSFFVHGPTVFGGRGLIRDYRVTAESAQHSGTLGRFKFLPWGVAGGSPGSRNYAKIIWGNGREPLVIGKIARLPVRRGDVVQLVTASGGATATRTSDRSTKLSRMCATGTSPFRWRATSTALSWTRRPQRYVG